MPQYLLSLVSSQGEPGSTSSHFNVKYNKPLVFKDGDWEVGLISASVPNTFFNISANIGNNKLNYYNGTVNQTLTFPDGMYSVDSIDTFIITSLGNNNIRVLADAVRLRVYITLSGNHEIDFTGADTFRSLLGFDPQVLSTQSTNLYAESKPDINNGNDSFYISCDLANSSFSRIGGAQANILYGFNFTVGQGSSQSIVPNEHVHLPVSKGYCDSITIRILNQDGNEVDLNDERVIVNIKVKKVLLANEMTF